MYFAIGTTMYCFIRASIHHRMLIMLSMLFVGMIFHAPARAHEPAGQASNEAEIQDVLVIQSYHEGMAWTDELNKGIKNAFKEMPHVRIHVEYMDTKRYPLVKINEPLINLLETKYKNQPPDVIIVGDNNALTFIQEHKPAVFPNIPVVFCGINTPDPEWIKSTQDFTGVIESTSPVRTVELFQTIHPGMSRLIVIADITPSGQAENKKARSLLGDQYQGVSIEYWDNMNQQKLLHELSHLNPKSDGVLLTIYNRDSEDQFWSFTESGKKISEASNAPVMGLFHFYIGTGVIGGHMVDGHQQGERAGQMAARILNGEQVHDIKIIEHRSNQTHVDLVAMEKWGLDPQSLPDDAVRHAEPASLLAKYWRYIILILIVGVLEAIALAVLAAIFYRYAQRTNQKIRRREERYAIAQESASVGTWDWDLKTGHIHWSDQIPKVLGFAEGVFDGTNETYQARVHPDDQEPLNDMLKLSLENDVELNVEYRFRNEDHEYRWKQSRGMAIKNNEGKPVRFIGITQDITDRKRMEKLYESFYQAMRSSHTPLLITDQDGKIRHTNPAFYAQYGYRNEEVINHDIRLLNASADVYRDMGYTQDEYEKTISSVATAIQNNEVEHWQGELLDETRQGKILTVQYFIDAIKGSNHQILGYVVMPVDITEQRIEQHQILLDCYDALSSLAETRDDETGQHIKRISDLCLGIAIEFNMGTRFCEDIATYSRLHDIGKVGIPDAILLAPRKLTDEEFAIMKTHAELGHKILVGRPTMEMAAEIARWHHERWDGTGYPDQLQGDEIPISARIMAIADVYDALRTKRRYKDAWSQQATLEYIESMAGKQFDPDLVIAFSRFINKQSTSNVYSMESSKTSQN